MWGQHLKRRGKWWHYYRAVPNGFRGVDARTQICFALKTTDLFEAKLRAAQISRDLEHEWLWAVELGVSLESKDAVRRYAAVADAQLRHGLKPQHAIELSNEDLLQRLQLLLETASPVAEQKSVLGLAEKPKLSMMDAYDRFWDHIEDEWSSLRHDQRRVKRNGYQKALSNFREAVGDVAMYDVERHHALTF